MVIKCRVLKLRLLGEAGTGRSEVMLREKPWYFKACMALSLCGYKLRKGIESQTVDILALVKGHSSMPLKFHCVECKGQDLK